jgi:hypothetical protein
MDLPDENPAIGNLSSLPVARIAVKMHDRHDRDVHGPLPEENTERKCSGETPPNIQDDYRK